MPHTLQRLGVGGQQVGTGAAAGEAEDGGGDETLLLPRRLRVHGCRHLARARVRARHAAKLDDLQKRSKRSASSRQASYFYNMQASLQGGCTEENAGALQHARRE